MDENSGRDGHSREEYKWIERNEVEYRKKLKRKDVRINNKKKRGGEKKRDRKGKKERRVENRTEQRRRENDLFF